MRKKNTSALALKNVKVNIQTLQAVNQECLHLGKLKERHVTQSEIIELAMRCYQEMKILHSGPQPRRKFDPLHAKWHTLLEEILTSGLPRYSIAIIKNLQGWGEAARLQGAKISDLGDDENPPTLRRLTSGEN